MTTSKLAPGSNATDVLDALDNVRSRGSSWLLGRIADDGTPFGHDQVNTWWRLPWSLLWAGEVRAAALVLSWAEREGLSADGDLAPGPAGGTSDSSPVYFLGPIAIAAWLLGRYDLGTRIMDRIETFQNKESGGVFDLRDCNPAGGEEWLKTCQVGITALVTGRDEVAHGVYRFLRSAYQAQPELPRRLYTIVVDDDLVTKFDAAVALTRVVDFESPRQLYYQPGIAAAFLAGYGSQFNSAEAIQLGRDLLELNTRGTAAQFEDPASVQISKFGWGNAAMLQADPAGTHLPQVLTMANWFIDRQNPDGSWSPSSFMVPAPTDVDKLWKTAEHLMIVSMIQAALV